MTFESRLGTWNNVAYTVRVSNDIGPASDLRKVRDREKKWEKKPRGTEKKGFTPKSARASEHARYRDHSAVHSLASARAQSARLRIGRVRVPSALAAPKGVARPRLRESNNSVNEGMDLS